MRRFKDATGTTPLDYLQRLRMRAAQRLLEDDHRGVSEVGAAVGYDDAAFFRALFKRHTGLADRVPSEIRVQRTLSGPACRRSGRFLS